MSKSKEDLKDQLKPLVILLTGPTIPPDALDERLELFTNSILAAVREDLVSPSTARTRVGDPVLLKDPGNAAACKEPCIINTCKAWSEGGCLNVFPCDKRVAPSVSCPPQVLRAGDYTADQWGTIRDGRYLCEFSDDGVISDYIR